MGARDAASIQHLRHQRFGPRPPRSDPAPARRTAPRLAVGTFGDRRRGLLHRRRGRARVGGSRPDLHVAGPSAPGPPAREWRGLARPAPDQRGVGEGGDHPISRPPNLRTELGGPFGYGYQCWLHGEAFTAIGIYNQYVWVDPSRR